MTMIDDPIVEELRAYRKAFAEAHGNDLMKIAEALKTNEKNSGRKYVSLEPKRIQNLAATQ